jgi:hypothetical protein
MSREGESLLCRNLDFAELVKESVRDGISLRFSAPGKSMSPSIEDGDVITVAPCGFSEVRLGDVVLFYEQNIDLMAHRVIRICRNEGAEFLVARGDVGRSICSRVTPEQVLGRVVAVERADRAIPISGRLSRWRGLMRNMSWRFLRIVRVRLARFGYLLFHGC